MVKLIIPCGLSEHFPDQTGLLLKRDSPGKVRMIAMMLHSDCLEMERGWGQGRGHFHFICQSDSTSHSSFILYSNVTSFN